MHLSILILFLSAAVTAQINIRGTVTSTTGDPIHNAIVILNSRNLTVSTNTQGNYTLQDEPLTALHNTTNPISSFILSGSLLTFHTAENQTVKITLNDLYGRLIHVITDKLFSAGKHNISLNGISAIGQTTILTITARGIASSYLLPAYVFDEPDQDRVLLLKQGAYAAVDNLTVSAGDHLTKIVPVENYISTIDITLTKDECPDDPEKTDSGECGCGKPEGTCSNNEPVEDGVIPVGPKDFSIGIIPDTQIITASKYLPGFKKAMEFFARHKDHLNLKAVASVGDMVADKADEDRTERWKNLLEAVKIIEEAGIPFIPNCGNHDGCGDGGKYGDPENFNKYFPYSQNGPDIYRGSYKDGTQNSWYEISHNNRDFLILSLEFANQNQTPEVNRIRQIWDTWADGIINTRPGHHPIVVTHATPAHDEDLCTHKNIVMAVQGHLHGGLDYRPIHCSGFKLPRFRFAFRHETDAEKPEAAAARYYTFKTEDNEICMRTFSAHHNKHLTDSDCYEKDLVCHEYCWDYDMSR